MKHSCIPPLSLTGTGRLLGGETDRGRDAEKGRRGAARVGVYWKSARLHSGLMLWFTIWFLVILKIPAVYLGYMIWWAVKDPPAPSTGPASGWAQNGGDGGGVGGPGRQRRRPTPIPGRRPGPHGVPARRPVPLPARERVSRSA
jgi:hypothetical protein